MHNAAGRESENSRDHQRASKQADHGAAMAFGRVPVCGQNADRQHDQREDRQKMDRRPRPPQPDRMNEERGDADHEHQRDPDPAERAVRQRAFVRRELEQAKCEATAAIETLIGFHVVVERL